MPSIIVWGDKSGRQAVLPSPVADIEVDLDTSAGSFQVQTPMRLPDGAWISVPGTCFGGWVTSRQCSTGSDDWTYVGKPWLGLLNERIVTPPEGQTNLTVGGDLTGVVKTLLENVGLLSSTGIPDMANGKPYGFHNADTGIIVPNMTIDRYVTASAALAKVLTAANHAGRVTAFETDIGVIVLVDNASNPRLISGIDTGVSMTYKTAKPVNHLIGLGEGEGTAREVIHRYADSDGTVSTAQTLKGLDEIQATYELSDKSGAELSAGVEAKLKSLQSFSSATITYGGGAGMLFPGDSVTVVDPPHGVNATATIKTAVFKLDNDGNEAVTWTVSDQQATD